ncbi:MAG: hypothetical protein ABWY18_01835 [Tardiphaga sp.]
MVEPVMYLAIGFLAAMLFSLMIMPLVHNRAVRLTTRRLEAATPLSMAEIQADKDQLRAEFAMSARRLEMSVEQLKNRTTSQLAELGKKSDAINRMKAELTEKNATIFDLEARETSVKAKLGATEVDFGAKAEALRAAEEALAQKQNELAKLNNDLADRSMVADSRQVELVTVRTHVEELRSRISEAEREFAATKHNLELQRGETQAATTALTEARSRVENLSQRVTDLDRQLTAQVREAEQFGTRAARLENELSQQTKMLAERDFENSQLLQASAAAEQIAQDLRVQIAAMAGGKNAPVVERLRSEKAAVEAELAAAREEHVRLQRDLTTAHQQAGNDWATERTENALLRERINDIAAEVARMAMTLEGPDSPIEAILAAEPPRAAPPQANGAGFAPNSTLADRIRALQSHASRAPQPV